MSDNPTPDGFTISTTEDGYRIEWNGRGNYGPIPHIRLISRERGDAIIARGYPLAEDLAQSAALPPADRGGAGAGRRGLASSSSSAGGRG